MLAHLCGNAPCPYDSGLGDGAWTCMGSVGTALSLRGTLEHAESFRYCLESLVGSPRQSRDSELLIAEVESS